MDVLFKSNLSYMVVQGQGQIPLEKKKVRLYDVSEEYEVLGKIGKGTYGTVFKVKSRTEKKNYAIKKLQNNDPKILAQGFPVTALREVMLLKQMCHPNVIGLRELVLSKPSKNNNYRGSTFLVLEYMDHDLAGVFSNNNVQFSIPQIKCIMKQMIEGVQYLHSQRILHRDIKPANVLLNDKGDIKLADFGLGRKFRDEKNLTFKVVTLWYRAPQLFMKYNKYDGKIDVWALGCVFAEFFIKQVLFKKDNQYAQFQKIMEVCGDYKANKVPKDVMQSFKNENDMLFNIKGKVFERKFNEYFRQKCPTIPDDALKLLAGLLDLNPKTRLSCSQALNHEFFKNSPAACKKSEIQKFQFEHHQLTKNSNIKIERDQQKESVKEKPKQYVKFTNKIRKSQSPKPSSRQSMSESQSKSKSSSSSRSPSNSSNSSSESDRSRNKNKEDRRRTDNRKNDSTNVREGYKTNNLNSNKYYKRRSSSNDNYYDRNKDKIRKNDKGSSKSVSKDKAKYTKQGQNKTRDYKRKYQQSQNRSKSPYKKDDKYERKNSDFDNYRRERVIPSTRDIVKSVSYTSGQRNYNCDSYDKDKEYKKIQIKIGRDYEEKKYESSKRPYQKQSDRVSRPYQKQEDSRRMRNQRTDRYQKQSSYDRDRPKRNYDRGYEDRKKYSRDDRDYRNQSSRGYQDRERDGRERQRDTRDRERERDRFRDKKQKSKDYRYSHSRDSSSEKRSRSRDKMKRTYDH